MNDAFRRLFGVENLFIDLDVAVRKIQQKRVLKVEYSQQRATLEELESMSGIKDAIAFSELILECIASDQCKGIYIEIEEGGVRAEVQIQSMRKDDNLVVLVNDISEIRRREQYEAQEKMQTVFFASVAHDLKTPVNSIYGAN